MKHFNIIHVCAKDPRASLCLVNPLTALQNVFA